MENQPNSPNGRKPLETRSDIERMVDRFYEHVRADPALGPIFDEIARVDWSHHLPKLYDFWETVLFGTARFKGNPMEAHMVLDKLVPLDPPLFQRWVSLFHANIDALFVGENAEAIKAKATSIAGLMEMKIAARRSGKGIL